MLNSSPAKKKTASYLKSGRYHVRNTLFSRKKNSADRANPNSVNIEVNSYDYYKNIFLLV